MVKKQLDDLYRPCVGVVLVNNEGKVFVGCRAGVRDNAWQMPQGGVDPGEDQEMAALRELYEETGVRDVEIIDRIMDPVKYDLPRNMRTSFWGGRYIGQSQCWFLMRFKGHDDDIDLKVANQEFVSWKWVDFPDVIKEVVPFKRDVYKKVVAAFDPVIKSMFMVGE